MSAVTATPSGPAGPASSASSASSGGRPGIPMGRLALVELRKALDTRAGRWFAIGILALVLLATGIGVAAFPESDQNFVDFVGLAGGVLGYFLPVLTILMVTSEWGQRTALATFSLEPRRGRVVAAKMLAGGGLALAVLAIGAVIAAIATVAGTLDGGSARFAIEPQEVLSFVLVALISVFIGFVLALVLRNSAAAIVGYFVYTIILPSVIGILSALVGWVEDLAPWVDLNTAMEPISFGDLKPTGEEWLQLGVTSVIWLLIPLAFGVWRLLRIEVK